jgi:lipopolysaccharide transport system permease protein
VSHAPGNARRQLAELLLYLHLVPTFALRDIRARYKQTAFGAAWAIIQPFSLMVVFTLVFSALARVQTDQPYPIFAYSTLIFWSFFASTLQQGTVAMTANASLVRKIYFPRETLLLSVILSAAVDLGVAFVLLLLLMAYYHVAVTWAILWTIPLLLLQAVLSLAVICVTSSIQVRYRDVGHALPLLVQLWMFATPVAYPLSLVPARLLPFYMLNPMVPIVEGYRRAILEGLPPDLSLLGLVSIAAVAVLVLAYISFKRAERTFSDVI